MTEGKGPRLSSGSKVLTFGEFAECFTLARRLHANTRVTMGQECRYSFDDLFRLAHDRDWTAEEKSAFMALDQDARNREVRRFAEQAGCIRTEDRLGTDGMMYTAFWAEDPE